MFNNTKAGDGTAEKLSQRYHNSQHASALASRDSLTTYHCFVFSRIGVQKKKNGKCFSLTRCSARPCLDGAHLTLHDDFFLRKGSAGLASLKPGLIQTVI
jgi:hypothetical protein